MTDAESSLSSREASVDAPPSGGALPEGAVTIAVGLIIAGAATYAFFRVGASALGGDEEFAPISSVVCDVRPCLVLSQSNKNSAGRSPIDGSGYGGGPVVAKIAILTLAVSVVVVIGLASSAPWTPVRFSATG